MKACENCVVNVKYVYIKIYNILKNCDDKHVTKMSWNYIYVYFIYFFGVDFVAFEVYFLLFWFIYFHLLFGLFYWLKYCYIEW
jgi:hypothetical protein